MKNLLSLYDKLWGKILLSILVAVFLGLIGFYIFPLSNLFYPMPDSEGVVPFLRGSLDVPVIIWYSFMLGVLFHRFISDSDMLVFTGFEQLAYCFFILGPFGLPIVCILNLIGLGGILFVESLLAVEGPINSFLEQLTEQQMFALGSVCSIWSILPIVDGLFEELRNREKVQ